MEKDIKLLIVPDVHGRDFWFGPVMSNLDKEIVFLGDYVDPYKDEGITKERAIEVLTEIIGLRRENENITLLLGNHDAGYALDANICECRRDWARSNTISDIFKNNIDLFDIAMEKRIGGKHFLLSHAGVHRNSWIKYNSYIFPKGFRASAKSFNEMLHSSDPEIRKGFNYALRDISFYRGGIDGYGSILWADIREFLKSKHNDKTKIIQIVGHTQLTQPINIRNKIYCLDCRRVFYIDSKGRILDYETDEEVTRTDQT